MTKIGGRERREPAIIKSKNSLSPTQKNTYSRLPATTPGLWLAAKRNSLSALMQNFAYKVVKSCLELELQWLRNGAIYINIQVK